MVDSIHKPAAGRTLSKAELVSVVIPCSNHARFLDQAVGSVLAQSYPNIEIIVVDGSTDNTAEVARRYSSVRYVDQEKNAGLSSARNAGLQQSRGEFLVFLDADDRLLPHAVETGVSCMHQHPECAFVSGHCRVIDSEGAILPSPREHDVECEHYLILLRGATYAWCPATTLYQRQIFDFAHGFDPAFGAAAAYELDLRIAKDFPVYSHDELIAEHRQHGPNRLQEVSRMQGAALAVYADQWDFIKANSRYREAYDAGRRFWKNDYPFQQMVNRIREVVREQLQPDAIVAVATGGNSELLRLDGRQAWHFPQTEAAGAGDLFAEGAEGSLATGAWIEAGMTYEFTLYGGSERSTLLARIFVRGVPHSVPQTRDESMQQQSARQDDVLLTANPNPVVVGEEPGTTNITWTTGDGSEGQVYVSSVGVHAGHEPMNSDEARHSLESARARGAQYLLVPANSFWWFGQYQEFREYLEACYPLIVPRNGIEDACMIFDLRKSAVLPAKVKVGRPAM